MRDRVSRPVLGIALVALAATAPVAFAGRHDEPKTVRDLAYGEVLFYFYQDDHFAALTRLLAALARDEMPSHARDADLLLGALYLSYGQHRLAGQIFDQVLADSVDSELRDRVWYFLAKIWYQRGYLDESAAALARITDELPDPLEPDRRMLEAQVLMDLGRFDDALAALSAWRRPQDQWVGYTKYNIGVALVRLGRVEDGARVLEEVGTLETDNSELRALKDKANVALGYAWLQAGQPLLAKPALQRVRLDGPYSNKALLGVGWADAEQENYRAALAPWIELRGRDLLDSAVQESLLAVPYAFAQLGAEKQAADYYVDAIEAFNSEIVRLNATMISVREGALVGELLEGQKADGSGWYWRLDDIPKSVESRYLYDLMAGNRFQEALKGYRDLLYLRDNLDRWADSLSVFDDILDTRQRAYEQRVPLIDQSLERMDLDEMARRRVALESRLLEVERAEDVVALGTPEQQSQWRKLVAMEPNLDLIEGNPRAAELRDKQRFLKGLLLWELRRDYRARLWAEQRDLRALDREIKEARRHYHEVSSAADGWPDQFADLTTRIGALRPRVEALGARAEATLGEEQAYLEDIVIDELQAQRDRLNTYMVQARFSLASIYDRAAAGEAPDAGESGEAPDPGAGDDAALNHNENDPGAGDDAALNRTENDPGAGDDAALNRTENDPSVGDERIPHADPAPSGVERRGLVAEERR